MLRFAAYRATIVAHMEMIDRAADAESRVSGENSGK